MKFFLWIFLAVFIRFCNTANLLSGALRVIDGNDPGQCNKSNHAEFIMVRNRENNDKFLICSNNNGVYQWRTSDGSTPSGEFFSPGYDCSDILDKDAEAKDGFYWVKFDSYTPRKVWCDMTTDGGGFMLVGFTNNSVMWSVPSNDNPVEPLGFPHWSSALGDASILDFRVQMSTGGDFKQTKSHWSFRLNNLRPLKNLMISGEKGCDGDSAGIGDIAYVKDIQTDEIVTTNFRCSKFGLGHQAQTMIGWSMMNSCFQKPCLWGFAYLHNFPVQVDYSGAFSYSATGQVSGILHNATAFVGCSKGNCCGCYGPVGGKQDYCSQKCQSLHGGTVTKNVYTWFWVRSALPKRVWNKCMEYKVKTDNGDVIWYKLVGGNVSAIKGRCVKNEVLLNDGMMSRFDTIIDRLEKQLGNQNRTLVDKMFSFSSIIDRLEKQLGNQNRTLADKMFFFSSIVDRLGNQNRTLSDKISYFSTIIDRLGKQLVNVNHTLENYLLLLDLHVSVILNRGQSYLSQLQTWLPLQSRWMNCYRASRDGWQSFNFHSRCDFKGPTVTIVRVVDYVFGGYTDVSWGGSRGWRSSSSSFIFSLKNKDNLQPFKAPVRYRKSDHAIYTYSGYGPVFGGGPAFRIHNNANSNTYSRVNFGRTYQLPSGYSFTTSNTRALLAGAEEFSPSEVEVFYLR